MTRLCAAWLAGSATRLCAAWLAGVAGIAAGVASAGCATEAAAPVGPLAVRAVAWPSTSAAIGPVRAVADAGDRVVIFGDRAAAIFVNGALVQVEPAARRWVSAATVPAADGAGTWIVGIDSEGRVLRLRGRGPFEGVSDRYGLEREAVRSAAALGGGGAAFALDDGIAVAQGGEVTSYATGPLSAFAAGEGRVAFAGDGLRVLDVATRAVQWFPLARDPAPLLAVTAAGKLVVATPGVLYGEDGGGALRLRLRASSELHGLAISGDRVWFADGEELGVLDPGGARETRGAGLPRDGRLIGSPGGDVWVLASGVLRRFAAAGAEPAWEEVAPVFARACAGCHLPRGEAGIDLSTRAAWLAFRDAIGRRVVTERTMPPKGHVISEADRARIRAFVRAGQRP